MPRVNVPLVQQWSDPADIIAFARLVPPGYVWRPPLMEHGPEQDDRWCLKHYKNHRADAWFGFHNFGCDLRHGRKCVYCAEDERKAWLIEVEEKLRSGLAAAARGEKVEW